MLLRLMTHVIDKTGVAAAARGGELWVRVRTACEAAKVELSCEDKVGQSGWVVLKVATDPDPSLVPLFNGYILHYALPQTVVEFEDEKGKQIEFPITRTEYEEIVMDLMDR
jgi:hypothetical protein